MRTLSLGSSSSMALAALAAFALSGTSLSRRIEPIEDPFDMLPTSSGRPRQRNAEPARVVVCANCGRSGGTLVNDNGDKSRKVHARNQC